MAIMIPKLPRDYEPASLEGEMFEALSRLSEDYYVIHSFKNVFVKDNILHEGETDFIIFNPNDGIICVEAKAGQVNYSAGEWRYSTGKPMKHGGPYNQAAQNKWDLLAVIRSSSLNKLQYRIKLLHAVWFPSIKESDLESNRFPAEFDRNITLTMEALHDPITAIKKIFEIELENNIKTDLSSTDVERLLREVICPEFNIFPTCTFGIDLKKIVFHRLLKEQQGLLNYLTDQRSAVINGAAGTGKTMIAVEKAMRHARVGQKVLFLCYNTYLREYLVEKYYHENIDYYTVAGFACCLCDCKEPDYKAAADKIFELYLKETFQYTHVIVDEGQDFGADQIEEAELLQNIHDIMIDSDNANGTFYVFYDKLQLVQAEKVPKYIADAECKLTLYKNCRNTENIAITSLKPITERRAILYEGAVKGEPARIHFRSDSNCVIERVKEIIQGLEDRGIFDIVILTCDTEKRSILAEVVKNGKFQKKLFTTCRKFKGLEADAIILVDITVSTFLSENVLRYYVGASRARICLEMITTMGDEECTRVLENIICYNNKIRKPKRELAIALNALPNIE